MDLFIGVYLSMMFSTELTRRDRTRTLMEFTLSCLGNSRLADCLWKCRDIHATMFKSGFIAVLAS